MDHPQPQHTDAIDADHLRSVRQLTRHSYAMVLAGGRGSRLEALTDWRAKPAVPFGGKFRIIDFTLSNCVNSGVRRIAVATQYKAQSLIRHLQRAWSFLDGRFSEFIDIMPAQQQVEQNWYRGTADAVFQNLDAIRYSHPEYVLILSGDHVYKMDYGKLLAFHARNRADVTVACVEVPKAEASGFGVIGIDEEFRVKSFVEKPADPPEIPGQPGMSMANMGVYAFNTRFLYEQLMRDADDPRSSHDFGHDILPHCVSRYRVFAQPFSDSSVSNGIDDKPYWRDVGTIDAYWAANMELTRVSPDLNMYDEEWPIWTYQEQTPPAKFVFDEENRRGAAVDSLVSGGVIISGAIVRRSLLFSRVRVHSYSLVEDSVVLPNVDVGRNCIIRRAVIDKRCRIPDGMRIGVDHEEDRRRFHISQGGVVLVTADMLGQGYHRVR